MLSGAKGRHFSPHTEVHEGRHVALGARQNIRDGLGVPLPTARRGDASGIECFRNLPQCPCAGLLRLADDRQHLSIHPPLDFNWQAEIDQSCLKERQREHVARMRVERIIELIAAALPELEMRAVAAAAEVWSKVDPVKQAICLRAGARYAVVVYLPPRLIHFLVELTWFKPDLFEAQLDPTGRVVFRVQTLQELAPRWRLGRYDFRLVIEEQLRFV